MLTTDAIEARETYRRLGFETVGLAPGDESRRHPWRRDGNIAIVLGRPGGLCAVCLTDPLAIVVAPRFLPPTGLISRIGACETSQYWYRECGEYRTIWFRAPRLPGQRTGRALCGYKGKGFQVAPPSVNPNGRRHAWSSDGGPGEPGAEELLESVRALHEELLRFC